MRDIWVDIDAREIWPLTWADVGAEVNKFRAREGRRPRSIRMTGSQFHFLAGSKISPRRARILDMSVEVRD